MTSTAEPRQPYLEKSAALQGTAGQLNNFTLTLVDVLGRPYAGGDTIQSTISTFQVTEADPEAEIMDVISNGDGTLAVQWAANLVNSSGMAVIYQFDVSLDATDEVCCLRSILLFCPLPCLPHARLANLKLTFQKLLEKSTDKSVLGCPSAMSMNGEW